VSILSFGQQNWTKARQEIHDNILLSASNYLAYIDPTEELTPAPKGYEPFYLSHYGRHGSRWLISQRDYSDAVDVLNRAHESGKLTETGEKLRSQLNTFHRYTRRRLGELSGVGERQHHRIGKRMTEHFPEIFKADNSQVDARSTVVIRCILSMVAECEEFAAFNPKIKIHNDVSESLQYYLNQDWERHINRKNREKWDQITFDHNKEWVKPERFWSLIMNDPDYRDSVRDSRSAFMKRVFDICSNMQSHFGNAADNVKESDNRSNDIVGSGLNTYSLYEYFTEEECYNLWRARNLEWYINYSSGISPFTQENLLKNILASADTIVNNKSYHGANVRFGHEVCVMPLAALLELGDCYPEIPLSEVQNLEEKWRNYTIYPMGSNIQLVFYRPKKGKDGDILVKGLLNEREVTLPGTPVSGPYYKWSELREYYTQKLAKYDAEYHAD